MQLVSDAYRNNSGITLSASNTGNVNFDVPDRYWQHGRANKHEDGGNQRMAHHHDPVQPGFVLHGFARDEMLFRVTQRYSLEG